MSIFIQIETEPTAQVLDKTRIDATQTFLSPDEDPITLLEIEPEASAGFKDCTANQYLDWVYATAGDKVVSVRVTTDGAPVTLTKTLPIVSEADDKLFSTDADLKLMNTIF